MSKRPLDPQAGASKAPRILDAPFAVVQYAAYVQYAPSTPHVPSTPSTPFDLLIEKLEPVSLKRTREWTEMQATKRHHRQ